MPARTAKLFLLLALVAASGGCGKIDEDDGADGAAVDADGSGSGGADSDESGSAGSGGGAGATDPDPNDVPEPDCEPLDLELFRLAYRDQDGDGHGTILDAVCAGDVLPEGYVLDSTDCEDGAPGVFPDAPDYPIDRIDTNCDGADGAAPSDPDKPDPYAYQLDSVVLSSPCNTEGQLVELVFGWRDIVCTTTDGQPDFYGRARALLIFRNLATEPTPATTAVLTSPDHLDFERRLYVPPLDPDESTLAYALGWIPPRIVLTFEAPDGTSCSDLPVPFESLGECVND